MFDVYDQDQGKKVTYYLVPSNVSAKFEFFEGFGWVEAKYVIVALVIGIFFYFVTGFITKTEQFNMKDLPATQTIGLKEDANTIIDGDIVTKKKEVIPKAVRFFFILVPGAGTFFVVKRDATTGMSLISNLKALKEFNKRQKRYLYKYNSGSGV